MNENNENNENNIMNETNNGFDDDEIIAPNNEAINDIKVEDSSFTKWDEANLKESVLRGIYSVGFEDPSPIQKRSIIPMVNGNDVIAQAQSGTGKTGAFSIGTLSLVDVSVNKTQAVILSPTRELSIQTFSVLKNLSTFMDGLKIKLLVGGVSSEDDQKEIRSGTPHIVVGCPGRTYDMMRRNHIQSKSIKLILLDEADEMLSTGFKEQVYNIFQFLNKDVQVCLFSATLPNEINMLTEKFMRDPIRILVKSEMLTLEGISQYYIALEDDQSKYSTLKDIFSTISMSQCIIYCNSIKRVEDLYNAMAEDNFPVSRIHGSMEREDRTKSYMEFKSGVSRVLISSNVTARGIDVQQVSTVINFDLSRDVHTYLHRIGRSGRWGRKGVGINFITKRDIKNLKDIEQHYNTQIEELPASYIQS